MYIQYLWPIDINKVYLHKKKERLGVDSVRDIAFCKIS